MYVRPRGGKKTIQTSNKNEWGGAPAADLESIQGAPCVARVSRTL